MCVIVSRRVQMTRLRRELERLTGERDRARDDGRRVEHLRIQLEAELKASRSCASSFFWSARVHALRAPLPGARMHLGLVRVRACQMSNPTTQHAMSFACLAVQEQRRTSQQLHRTSAAQADAVRQLTEDRSIAQGRMASLEVREAPCYVRWGDAGQHRCRCALSHGRTARATRVAAQACRPWRPQGACCSTPVLCAEQRAPTDRW